MIGLKRLGMATGLAGLLLGGACGGDDDVPASPDAAVATPDAAGSPDADTTPTACVEQSGHACVWLGMSGQEGFNGDGRDRLATKLYWPFDMTFLADGTPWFIDWNNHIIRRVKSDQTVETVVGWSDPIFPGDGTGDATEKSVDGADGALVQLNHPTELVQRDDGKVLLMAWHNHKLRTIDPTTLKVHIIAGGGAGYSGDGGQATAALFKQPKALARDTAGNLYIGDQQNRVVRRIDATTGVITTIVGTGAPGSNGAGADGDGGLATAAQLSWEVNSNPEPSGDVVWNDDKLYIADTLSHRIRVVDLGTGIITNLAGTGEEGYAGDGGLAVNAQLNFPRDLEFGPDGDLYIADTDNSVIRAVDLTTGLIRTVAGTGVLGMDAEDGKLATETMLKRPFGISFDADGNLYISDTLNSRILKVTK